MEKLHEFIRERKNINKTARGFIKQYEKRKPVKIKNDVRTLMVKGTLDVLAKMYSISEKKRKEHPVDKGYFKNMFMLSDFGKQRLAKIRARKASEQILIYPVKLNHEGEEIEPHESCLQRLGFTYLHGQLQSDNGYDIFCTVGFNPTKDGIYEAKVIGFDKPATFYLWRGKDTYQHGLVVYNDDTPSVEHALRCYQNKLCSI